MKGVEQRLSEELEQRLRFESLVAELSVRLINLPTEQIDGALEEGQRLFCEPLGLDRSSLFQRFEAEPEALLLTHLYRNEQDPFGGSRLQQRLDPQLQTPVYWVLSEKTASPTYLRLNARTLFPWVYEQMQQARPVVVSHLEELPAEAALDRAMLRKFGTRSTVILPLTAGGTWLGCLAFASLHEARAWSQMQVERFQFVAHLFANALSRKRAETALRRSYEEIRALRDRLQAESEYLKGEIQLSQPHQEIVGRSRAIREALYLAEQVGPTDSVVLLTGETGTGKELLARAIHRLSPRRERLMVEVNCAALPEALVESELFGRERGAYTGALTTQMGRFEVADGSTIFLDEVGELSLEVQAKLLRVLQLGQFQRLGNPQTRQVNVRVIAATNHELAQAVQQGRFREDLYYRLNVFSIRVPPLRERVEDVPLLVLAFVEEFCSRMGKPGLKVPRRVMETLERHDWPGNIRELRNVIERGIILSPGDTLKLTPLRENELAPREPATLAQAEQQHILKTLERTGWRIKGPHGAAQVLGLKPGTLYSRMRKLGIPHRREKDGIPTQGRHFIPLLRPR